MFGRKDFEKQPTIKPPKPPKKRDEIKVKEAKAPRAPGEKSPTEKAVGAVSSALSGVGGRLKSISLRRKAGAAESPISEAASSGLVDAAGAPIASEGKVDKQKRKAKASSFQASGADKAGKPAPRRVSVLPGAKAAPGVTTFANSMEDIEAAPPRSRVILWGEAVISDVTEGTGLEELVAQPPRSGSSGGLSLGKSGSKMHVWLLPQQLRVAAERNLTINLAIDYALAYGLRQQRNCLVIVGCLGGADGSSVVDVLSFGVGKLVGIEQRALQSRSGVYYQESVQGLISDFVNRDNYEYRPEVVFIHPEVAASHVYKGPVTILESNFFDKRIATSINYGFRIHTILDVVAPAAIILTSALGSAYVLWNDWQAHQNSVRQFQQSVSGVEDDYAKGQASLQLLQAQKQFLETPVPQREGVKRLTTMLRGVALEQKGFIKSLSFTVTPDPAAVDPTTGVAPAGGEDSFVVSISAPTNPSLSSLEQAQEILDAVAKTTGATVQMTARKTEPDPTNSSLVYRVFDLVGKYPPPETPGA